MKTPGIILNILSVRDGGPGQRWAMTTLRNAKIPFRTATSPLYGHYGIQLMTRNKRLVKRTERLVY